MGKWLRQLRNQETPGANTDITDKNPSSEVSSVLSVRPKAASEYFSTYADVQAVGSDSFVASSEVHFPNCVSLPDRAGWDNEDWQTAFDERAAVLEFDEGLTRANAERQAGQEIAEERKRWMQ